MQFQQNFQLRQLNTFRLAALAEYFSVFQSPGELQQLLSGNNVRTQEVFILGGGSNILFTGNVKGFVLKNEIAGIEVVAEDDTYVYVRAGAGEDWHQFVLFCLERGLGGVENLSLIPGSVGASPMQNIGAYGVEVKDVFHELEAFHLEDKQIVTFSNNDCAFGYRESVFKNTFRKQYVILSVTFRLQKVPRINTSYGALEQELQRMEVGRPDIRSVSRAVINIRRSKLPDPAEIGNAGSFFKNPELSAAVFASLRERFPGIAGFPLPEGQVKIAAGWMIEQCGWKGYRQGDAGCYAKQALVLVNYGNAAGSEIYALSEAILQSVWKKFGVWLEREVNIAGG